MKISVACTGYVELINAIILAQNVKVYTVDIAPYKVDLTATLDGVKCNVFTRDLLNRD